ncbi:hypothetical protein [Vibrio harveyi]|uniref:hypothetical protein n=1 Tax=Vibrio harveyi TaxID=669 RepID=UPI00165D85F8|nr:hypothetical protein [Vibrio harveyi]
MSIKDLPITPPDSDPVLKLDDELRELKGVIKQAFPHIDGAVSATAAEINAIPTLISDLDAALDQVIVDIDAEITAVQQAVNEISSRDSSDFGSMARLSNGLIFPITSDPLKIGSDFVVCNGRGGTLELDATGTPFTAFVMYRGNHVTTS